MAINTKELISLSIPYFIGVGACYLFGYWGAIGVNVLEFIGFADIAKLAVYPLVAGMTFTALGAVFSEITTGKVLPIGGGEHTAVGRHRHNLHLCCRAFQVVCDSVFCHAVFHAAFALGADHLGPAKPEGSVHTPASSPTSTNARLCIWPIGYLFGHETDLCQDGGRSAIQTTFGVGSKFPSCLSRSTRDNVRASRDEERSTGTG
jgi:hypothetical protein